MINPKSKNTLNIFTKAVKVIIEDAGRMMQLAPMLDTRDGSIKAVAAIFGAIEQKMAIPADVKSMLAVKAYFLMVDMLQEARGEKPDIQMVHQTMLAILKAFSPNKPQGQPAQPPAGLINGVTT